MIFRIIAVILTAYVPLLLISTAASAQPQVSSSRGPRFITLTSDLILKRWSAAFSTQTLTATGSKGMGLEAMTPSLLYGTAAARIGFHRNYLQGLNAEAEARNPATNLEYEPFNIIHVSLIFPMRFSVNNIIPYFGGSVNFVLADKQIADNITQVNFGVLTGLNFQFSTQDHELANWANFAEFAYHSENPNADNLVDKPAFADGFVTRAGVRYFF